MTSTRASRFILLGLLVLLPMSLAMYATGSSSAPSPAEEPSAPPPAGEVEPLFIPQPKTMSDCITCTGSHATDIHWGTGSNCTEAKASLDSQLGAAATDYCRGLGARGACDLQVHVTAACYFNPTGGYYIVDGYATFSCLEGKFFCQQ